MQCPDLSDIGDKTGYEQVQLQAVEVEDDAITHLDVTSSQDDIVLPEFSKWHKRFIVVIVSLCGLVSPLSSHIYVRSSLLA